MASLSERVNIGIGVLVYDNRARLLMGQRINDKHGKGEFSLPGGKPDPYESPREGACRELMEETGICVPPVGMHKVPGWTYDRYDDWGVHFVTVYFSCNLPMGQHPENMEPEKCGGWDWYYPGDLPRPLFSGVEEIVEQQIHPRMAFRA